MKEALFERTGLFYYLYLMIRFVVYLIFAFCVQIQAQQSEDSCRQLSIKTALVIPISYRFEVGALGSYGRVQADFKFASNYAIQYKTKDNGLLEILFQSDNISFKGPTESWNNGYHYGNKTYYYYQVVSYTQYRISLGIGRKKSINKNHAISYLLSVAGFFGDRQYLTSYESKVYNVGEVPPTYGNGIPSGWASLGFYSFFLAPQIQVCHSYNIIKNLALITAINYCPAFFMD